MQQTAYAADLCDFSYAMPHQQHYAQQSASNLFGASYSSMAANNARKNMINSHNNFISQVGYLTSNNNCKQTIKIAKGYSQIVVYVIGNSNTIKR
jgi:hypothetical protein